MSICSLALPLNNTFIDRFLATSQAFNVETILLFNKLDAYDDEEFGEMKYLAEVYRNIGYTCVGISALTGQNLDQVKILMKGKTCVFSGH